MVPDTWMKLQLAVKITVPVHICGFERETCRSISGEKNPHGRNENHSQDVRLLFAASIPDIASPAIGTAGSKLCRNILIWTEPRKAQLGKSYTLSIKLAPDREKMSGAKEPDGVSGVTSLLHYSL
jgi:hypothetical protein